MQFHRIQTEYSIFADDLPNCPIKTGDIILFKAYNNFNSIFHGSYFGHIGVVYIDKNNNPMLFEANGIEKVPLRDHHSKRGVFLTPLIDRIKKYKGRCFWKPLNRSVSPDVLDGFKEFVQFSLTNLEYDYSVITGGIKRMLGLSKCGLGTDCGQIVFLSLIKLGLINVAEYDVPRLHHLRYVCNVTDLQNGYCYLPLVEIIDHPFAD
jgi:hypothetical protein